MIVFVVYSETCRQSSKIIDGPRGVVPPLSLVTMWRQEASVTTSSNIMICGDTWTFIILQTPRNSVAIIG